MAATPSVTVAFSSDYTPYGSSYALVGVEALMYTGKEYDSATGLYYEGARYYDPTTGRFVTEDSYGGTRGDPMTLNRYVYAADDPMRYVDPTGHMLAAASGGGDIASTPTCTTSPDVCASESGANAASLVTVSPGISAKPPDVELTQGGSDQYTNEPMVVLTRGGGPTIASLSVKTSPLQELLPKSDTSSDLCLPGVCFNPGVPDIALGSLEVAWGTTETAVGVRIGPLGAGLISNGQSVAGSGLNGILKGIQECSSGGCQPILIEWGPGMDSVE